MPSKIRQRLQFLSGCQTFIGSAHWTMLFAKVWALGCRSGCQSADCKACALARNATWQKCSLQWGHLAREAASKMPAAADTLNVQGKSSRRKLQRPVLHMVCDLAPIGWPAANFLVQCLGLRGTLVFDLLHRRVCDIDDGRAEAGLRMLKTEYNVVLKMRQGPYQQSGHHSVLRDSAAEMFRETTADNNLLFAVLSDSIAADFQMQSQTQATEEHTELVWRAAKQLPHERLQRHKHEDFKTVQLRAEQSSLFPSASCQPAEPVVCGDKTKLVEGVLRLPTQCCGSGAVP